MSPPRPTEQADDEEALTPEHIARAFLGLFPGRRDAYGSHRGGCVKRPLTEAVVCAHLKGKGAGIGLYLMTDDNKVWMGVIDYDTAPRGRATAASRQRALDGLFRARQVLAEDFGITAGVDVELGDRGGHLWLRLDAPVPAYQMRRLLTEVARRADLRDHLGKPAEVFPKSDSLRATDGGEKAYGNYVNLPYHGGMGS